MGFPEDKVLEALTITDGDKTQAAQYLMDSSVLWLNFLENKSL